MAKLFKVEHQSDAESEVEDTAEVLKYSPNKSWVLEWVEQGSKRIFQLDPGKILRIGSSSDAEIQVFDQTVSSLHCALEVKADRLKLVDLGSLNGVLFSGALAAEAVVLFDLCSFTLGRVRFTARDRSLHLKSRRTPLNSEQKGLGVLVGTSAPMERLKLKILRYASLKAPVMILGESGTGKDLVASSLHGESQRDGSYVALNVAALSGALIDAELFGHEKGAFTGAVQKRRGAFQRADKGTLFLDEIAEMSQAGQAKLLRVVEDGRVRAVGADSELTCNVRIITATCASLEQMCTEGAFREDLFHRLGTLLLRVPPLRERTSDIPELVEFFFRKISHEVGPKFLNKQAMTALQHQPWPGNIRQLFGTLYRAAVLSDEVSLEPTDLDLASSVALRRPCLSTADAQSLLQKYGSISAAARAARMPRTSFRTILFK